MTSQDESSAHGPVAEGERAIGDVPMPDPVGEWRVQRGMGTIMLVTVISAALGAAGDGWLSDGHVTLPTGFTARYPTVMRMTHPTDVEVRGVPSGTATCTIELGQDTTPWYSLVKIEPVPLTQQRTVRGVALTIAVERDAPCTMRLEVLPQRVGVRRLRVHNGSEMLTLKVVVLP